MSEILASRPLTVRITNVIRGVPGDTYAFRRVVALSRTSTGTFFMVGMDTYRRVLVAPDGVRLVRHGGTTPAGNPIHIWVDIPRAAYDELLSVATQRFPDDLRLRTEEVESLGVEWPS